MATFEQTRPIYARCLWVTLGGWAGAIAGYALGALGSTTLGTAMVYLGTVVGCLGFIRGVFVPIPAMDDAHAPREES